MTKQLTMKVDKPRYPMIPRKSHYFKSEGSWLKWDGGHARVFVLLHAPDLVAKGGAVRIPAPDLFTSFGEWWVVHHNSPEALAWNALREARPHIPKPRNTP